MREMLETHTAVVTEHQGRARRLEGELKALQERLAMVERAKQAEIAQMEKRIADS
jgi:uncharacterized coiled-coil protein SlyX